MKRGFLLAFVWIFMTCGVARAELSIDVTGAMREPMPVAFPEMVHDGFWVGRYGDDIRKVVMADLERSGLFKFIDEFRNFLPWRKSLHLSTGKQLMQRH